MVLRIGGSPVLRSKPGGKAAPWDCLGPIYWEAARITDMSSTPWAILRPAITVIISNWSVLNIRCVENALTLTLITCGGHYDYNAYFIHKETERPLTQSQVLLCRSGYPLSPAISSLGLFKRSWYKLAQGNRSIVFSHNMETGGWESRIRHRELSCCPVAVDGIWPAPSLWVPV